MKNNNGKLALSFLAGAAIGTGLGILFAPDKGSETREKIKQTVTDASHEISDRLKHAKEELTKTANEKKEAFEKKLDATISNMSYKAEDIITSLEAKLEDLKKKNARLQK